MKRFVVALIIGIFSSSASAQEKFTLSGTVSDNETNETLIGVNLKIMPGNIQTATNEYGFYSVNLPKGSYTIEFFYTGYQYVTEIITLNTNLRKNLKLAPQEYELEEVIVRTNPNKANIKKPEMSVNKLSVTDIKKMPVVMGEVDILKSILQLPGVTNAGEGASGFNVRGGAADQNLILLDEATVFNSSHLFGFFSVFNADAIKNLKLYKGGIPARYGGRVSSVLDIYQKEGNSKKFATTGGIGLISSRLLVEAPIIKDKMSFLAAGRSSYAHLFLKLFDNDNAAYFYDLNTKLNYKLNENNNLYLSGYFGRDVFDFQKVFVNRFGNALLNLRWNHLFSEKLFSNMSFIYSDYYYGLTLDLVKFNWDSGIKNYNFKYDFNHNISDKLRLFYGTNHIYYNFNPGTLSPSGEDSAINNAQLDRKYAYEPSVYIDAEHSLSDKISVSYGLRYSMFYRLGAQKMNVYADNNPVEYLSDVQVYQKATPIGTVQYRKGEVIADYGNFEPRLGLAFILDETQSIKASYNRMAQYIHLISNTSAATPLDVWAPSDKFIKPQLLNQYALGYFKNFKNGDYVLETEVFYKDVKNRIDYIDGAELIANNAIEQVILNGESRAYGLELMIKKNEGDLTGWISYTLSRSEQKTEGRTADEIGINYGNWYKTPYDKLHNLSITALYTLTEKWNFGTIFTLQSGRPVTFPNGFYEYQGMNIPNFGLRNKDLLPVYHHLDISATYIPKPRKVKGWKGEWVLSIYNVYNRKNAASISFRQNELSGKNEAVRLSIFGIVPSITYNFKF